MSMISDGAFSIFKRFSSSKKPFHEMPVGKLANFWRRWESERFWFNIYILYIISSRDQYVQMFNPLHFDMLNATPHSLSKEGNLILGRAI
jgi:hypothetical protein